MSNVEFTNAYGQFEHSLFSFARHLTNTEDDALDLMQETAYKAFKYRKMYKPHTNLKAWLMTIMRNTFINDYRQKKRRQTLNDSTSNNFFLNSGDKVVNNMGESLVTLKEVTRVVDDLEDWMRIPFLMYFNGYKYDEIAEELGIPLGTVKSRIYFARQRLKSTIGVMYNSRNVAEIVE